MQKFNYHTHTLRCGHAGGDDEQYVKAAIAAGYEIVGFSDHSPYPGVIHPGDRMRMDELDGYLASIRGLSEKYRDRIELKVGLEIEYFPEMEDFYRDLRKITDYLIVGQHNRILDAMEYDKWCDDEDVLYYAWQIRQCVEHGFADIIAHPDYFMLGRKGWSAACETAARDICAVSLQYNIPLELNLNGLRYGKQHYDDRVSYPYPYRPFWEIISETQAPVVYGVDAHKPMNFMEKERYVKVMEDIKDLKLNFITDFRI